MPPLPPVGNVLKVELKGIDSGGFPWVNVLHYLYSGSAPSNADLDTLAGFVGVGWSSSIAGLCPTTTSLEEVVITDLTGPSFASGVDTTSRPGTRVGSGLPSNVAMLISYPGAGPRYRGGHPRQYLNAGVDADILDSAHWEGAFVTASQADWINFTTGIIGTTVGATTVGDQVAVSYYTTDYGPPKVRVRRPVPQVYEIINRVANAEIASQRGRIGRRR